MTQPRLFGGRYELGELIGYGGMAEVHRGWDTRLNREVAIKVLRADLARDPSFLARFRREAHSAAGLNHPSIVAVYDSGEDIAADGTAIPFIVMEFVQGRTLREILKSEHTLPPRRAMEITADVCAALDFSHRNGIVHRDIKPANVMITTNGAVKVMDFGIARAVADTSATVTQTANVIGTAQYLSPEQARGETVDARSDVYSTGCLLYELVTGVPPFQGDSPVAVAYQHVRENPVAPSSRNPAVPRALDSIIMKSLAKNQLNRYQSAGDMRADLERAMADQPVVAELVMTDDERTQIIARTQPPPPPSARAGYPVEGDDDHSARRTGLIWTAIVVALLIVIGVAAYAIVSTSGSSDGPKMITVKNVIGTIQSVASRTLQEQGLKPSVSTGTKATCTGGVPGQLNHVCQTIPGPGQSVQKGSNITIYMYAPAQATVPNVRGQTQQVATDTLSSAGFKVAVKHVNQAGDVGKVVDQDPPGNTSVTANSNVTITVSTGKVQLPDETGKNQDDAESDLSGDGFNSVTTQTVTTADKAKDGLVKSMSPKPGGYYLPNVKITLTVYNYVAPQPTCQTVQPTPPTSPSVPSSGGSGPGLPGGPSGPSGASTSNTPATQTSSSSDGLPPCK